MPTKEDLERENAQLRDEIAQLREQGPASRPVPTEPSFGICEGVRTDLEQVDKTTDPFTGKPVTRADVDTEPYDLIGE